MSISNYSDAALAGRSSLVDLGVILAEDVTGGESVDLRSLIGAPVGAMVQLLIANDDFVAQNSDADIFVSMYNDRVFGVPVLYWYADTGVAALQPPVPYVEDGQPLLFAGDGSLATVGAIHLKAVVTPG
jgi:hypothetical protein